MPQYKLKIELDITTTLNKANIIRQICDVLFDLFWYSTELKIEIVEDNAN